MIQHSLLLTCRTIIFSTLWPLLPDVPRMMSVPCVAQDICCLRTDHPKIDFVLRRKRVAEWLIQSWTLQWPTQVQVQWQVQVATLRVQEITFVFLLTLTWPAAQTVHVGSLTISTGDWINGWKLVSMGGERGRPANDQSIINSIQQNSCPGAKGVPSHMSDVWWLKR